jgi:hypothetical protein
MTLGLPTRVRENLTFENLLIARLLLSLGMTR